MDDVLEGAKKALARLRAADRENQRLLRKIGGVDSVRRVQHRPAPKRAKPHD
jgi:hypothetical protein